MDSFWLGETHFRPNQAMLSSPLIGASAVAARTTKMKVGTAVQVLPLADPLRIAEEAALVDHLSDGRLIFGVGRSSFIDSYNGFNINYEESRGRFLESLEIIREAWGDQPFSYEGEYYTVNNVSVVPKPYQNPHPPIRMAAASADTFPLAGSLGLPIFMRSQMPIPEMRDLLRQCQEAREEAGFGGPNDVILPHITEMVGNFAAHLTRDEMAYGAQERGLNWGSIRAPDELVDEGHLNDRGFWVEVPHPELDRSFKYPGPAGIYNGSPWRISRRAPLIGEHNEEIYCGELGLQRTELAYLAESGVV